jgi:hypothetical protein
MMMLKMNMCPVRLKETGRHLFDAPYCYSETVQIDTILIERHGKVYYVQRDLDEAERVKFASEIKRLNDDQERKWDVNQPKRS